MASSQDTITDKRGGICFRVDDNQPIQKWTDYAEIFNRHGYKFCAALCPGRMIGNDEYMELVRQLQAQGHEILDHTPIHSVDKLPLLQGADPNAWRKKPGVDHVDEKLIYLTYEKIDTEGLSSGRADISGNRMAGRSPGDLDGFSRSNIFAVYLPDTGGTYRFKQEGEGDNAVLKLHSFWEEDTIDLGELRDVVYYKLGKPDVYMTLDARKLLAEMSLELFEEFGFQRPVTWIQPGSGGCSDFYCDALKECFGDLYGYVSAATYPDRALKCYNEYDPAGDKRFGMQWGNFNEEAMDLKWNQKRIADGIAKHHVLIGHCHFWERLMPDGWDGFLKQIDQTLSWCRQTGIPVKTYAEWAQALYHTKQDPSVDVFPGLEVDRDGDGVPDGYDVSSEKLDRSDGAPGGLCLTADSTGAICRVKGLAGLEKGANTFAICTRGSAGGSIEVTFDFSGTGTVEKLTFPAASPGWTEHEGTVTVPTSASLADISIDCTGIGDGALKISGMSLKQPTSA